MREGIPSRFGKVSLRDDVDIFHRISQIKLVNPIRFISGSAALVKDHIRGEFDDMILGLSSTFNKRTSIPNNNVQIGSERSITTRRHY